MKNRLMA